MAQANNRQAPHSRFFTTASVLAFVALGACSQDPGVARVDMTGTYGVSSASQAKTGAPITHIASIDTGHINTGHIDTGHIDTGPVQYIDDISHSSGTGYQVADNPYQPVGTAQTSSDVYAYQPTLTAPVAHATPVYATEPQQPVYQPYQPVNIPQYAAPSDAYQPQPAPQQNVYAEAEAPESFYVEQDMPAYRGAAPYQPGISSEALAPPAPVTHVAQVPPPADPYASLLYGLNTPAAQPPSAPPYAVTQAPAPQTQPEITAQTPFIDYRPYEQPIAQNILGYPQQTYPPQTRTLPGHTQNAPLHPQLPQAGLPQGPFAQPAPQMRQPQQPQRIAARVPQNTPTTPTQDIVQEALRPKLGAGELPYPLPFKIPAYGTYPPVDPIASPDAFVDAAPPQPVPQVQIAQLPANGLPQTPAPVPSGAQTIPFAAKAAAVSNARYRIQPGDTLYSIARRHGVKVDVLARVNQIQNQARISAGQELIIPGLIAPASETNVTHAAAPSITQTPPRLAWPVHGNVFARKDAAGITGLDIHAAAGTPVFNAHEGRVAVVEDGPQGQLLIIDHQRGWRSYYLGLEHVEVRIGDLVGKHQPLARIAARPMPVLGFEIRLNGVPFDPVPLLKSYSIELASGSHLTSETH